MKAISHSLLGWAGCLGLTLALLADQANAQEPVPVDVGSALGANSSLACFSVQICIDRIAQDDLSKEENYKRAIRDLSALQAGMSTSVTTFKESLKHFSGKDAEALEGLLKISVHQAKQIDTLLKAKKTEHNGEDFDDLKWEFKETRADTLEMFRALGFHADLFD